MTPSEAQINTFLVDVFSDVLRLENESLRSGGFRDLSVSEMHVLEAVRACGEEVGMSRLAAALELSGGSVTTAVKTLEQKGYLQRRRSENDKRRVYVALTAPAVQALRRHSAFHEKLVGTISAALPEAQQKALADALSTLHGFFSSLSSD